ncbi:YugN family protein [Salimicrobium sp. PL1-032A]|uniref:YugN family protein n=1 Tax=Salimicrobium sp. PL1-032A TaxID=3095364 RepID=UPI0032611AA0
MKLENTGIEDLVLDVKTLTRVMESKGFMLGGSWDYERVTYDYKVESNETNITHYVRIQGYALEGDVDKGNAVIKLLTPILGRHYYPHGVEYGDTEEFSKDLIDKAHRLIKNVQPPAEANQVEQ